MSLRQLLYFPFMVTGINPRKLINSFRGFWRYVAQYRRFRKMGGGWDNIPLYFNAPCVTDWYESCGSV